MMRAVLIVIGVITLAVMELRTPPRFAEVAKAVPDRFEQLTIGANLTGDTPQQRDRPKGDRFDIFRAHYEPPAQQTLFAERFPQPDARPQPAVKAANPQKSAREEAGTATKTATKTIARSKRAVHDNKTAIAKPKPKPAHAAAKRTTATPVQSRAASETKLPCKPNAFDRLLQTLNLSPGCET